MKVLHTTKSRPEIRTDITQTNARDILKNNTVIAVFKILEEVEIVALNASYYGDFVKKEQEKGKKFIGSGFIKMNGQRKRKFATDKVTELVDKKLGDNVGFGDQNFIMEKTKEVITALLGE